MNQRQQLLALVDPEGKFPEKVVNALIDLATPAELKRGEFFISSGMTIDKLALIVQGCMRYYYLKDGMEITGEFWQEGELAGSYESSILVQPSSLFIEAIEDTSVLTFSYGELKELATKYKIINSSIIRLLEKFIIESQQRIASYITETAEERYLRLREEMPGIENRVHQKYIASFVGVTPVTLSRIRARLAHKDSL